MLNVVTEDARSEEISWRLLQYELAEIERNYSEALEHWVRVGHYLLDLQSKYPPHGGQFGQACARHEITLTVQQRSAMWWTTLEDDQRATLREESPEALEPESLQKACRKYHPAWAKRSESSVFGRSEDSKTKRKRGKKPILKVAGTEADEAEPKPEKLPPRPKPTARTPSQLRAQQYKTTPPQPLQPKEQSIIWYGVQLWPPDPANALMHGVYDYRQWFCAIRDFRSVTDLFADRSPHSIAQNMRTRCKKFKLMFADGYSTDKAEALRDLVGCLDTLTTLMAVNPEGECQIPADIVLFKGT
jgi:hypothetical protein